MSNENNDDDNSVLFYFQIFQCLINFLFILFGLIRIFNYSHIGYYNREIIKWTTAFTIKFLSNFMISINYVSFPLAIYYSKEDPSKQIFYYFITAFEWIFLTSQVYFEFRKKLSHTWNGLKGIWMLNFFENIGIIIYIFTIKEKDLNSLKFFFLTQTSFFLILFYFSIFDSEDKDVKIFEKVMDVNISNNKLIQENNSTIEANILKYKSILGKDTKIFNQPYQQIFKKENIINIEIYYVKPKSSFLEINQKESENLLKMRFLISFNKSYFKNFNGDFNYKVDYYKKKSIKDILNFNSSMIKILSEKLKISPILLHFKVINQILGQNYNKYYKKKKLRNKHLEKIYLSLFNKFKFFVDSFMIFLDLKDIDLQEYIKMVLKINNYSEKNNSIMSIEKYENDFEDMIFDNNQTMFRLYVNEIQLNLNFINNLIINRNFINLKIKKVKFIGSEINYTFNLIIIDNSKTNEIKGIISSADLKRYCLQNIFNKCKNIRRLSQIVYKTKDIISNNDENYFNKLLSKFLQLTLTDLFFLDNTLFKLFKFNNFLENEINNEILNYFFYYNDLQLNIIINLSYPHIDNFEINCEWEKIDLVTMKNNKNDLILYIKMTAKKIGESSNITWILELSVKDQNDLFEDLLKISENKYSTLKRIIEKIYNLIKDTSSLIKGNHDSQIESFISNISDLENENETKEKMEEMDSEFLENIKSNSKKNFNELIFLYNKLFQRKYRHVFYSKQFRELFELEKLLEGTFKDITMTKENFISLNHSPLKKLSFSNENYSLKLQNNSFGLNKKNPKIEN